MSRSLRALTEGCTPVSAVRGAGKRAELEATTRLGCLLGAVPSITRLLWVVAASATVLALAPAPAPARSERSRHAKLPITQLKRHSHTPKATDVAGRALHRPPARSPRRAAHSGYTPAVVLALGSGYGHPGGSTLVRSLQRRLAVAGFGPGPVDGLYGPRTEAAVSRLQAATGLSIDGIAGPRTLATLSAPAPTLYPSAAYQSGGSRPVRELQRLLARAGYNPGGVDGLYGPRTEGAIKRFQAEHGLRVDGIAHSQTFSDLRKHVLAQRHSRPTTTHPAAVHPKTAPRNPAHAPAPTTGGRTNHIPQSPSIGWFGLLAAVLGTALLFTLAAHTRRRRAACSSSSPKPSDRGGEPVAPLRDGSTALAGSHNRHARETREHPAENGTDPGAVFRLGVLLEEQNDLAGALAAYRRADLRGHAAAASNLGVLLERRGDLEGAEAAYRRADERGDPNGAFNLAGLFEERNDLAGAEAAYRRADQRGPAEVANAARAALLSLGAGANGARARNGGDLHVE